MGFKLGKPRQAKDVEASTGPKMLVTINTTKLTPSPSVFTDILEAKYDKDGKLKNIPKAFNIGFMSIGDSEPQPVLYLDEEGGYVIGKNKSVSAAQPIRDLLAFYGKDEKDYLKEKTEDNPNPVRSFDLSVNTKGVTVYLTPIEGKEDEFDTSMEETEGSTALTVYPMELLEDSSEGAEDDEVKTQESKSAKKGKKTEE